MTYRQKLRKMKTLTELREHLLKETLSDLRRARLPKDMFGDYPADHTVDIAMDNLGIDHVLRLVREFLFTGK